MKEEKESVYLETSIISYYTSIPNPDLTIRVHQEITKNWWPTAIRRYDIFISRVVILEISSGDVNAVKRRLDSVKDFIVLETTEDVEKLSELYIEELKFPQKSIRDAAHIAVTCLNNIDYLVTWNCSHICNGEIIKKLTKVNGQLGVHTPIICTPEQLMEVNHGRSYSL